MGNRINLLLGMLMLSCTGLFAQQQDSVHSKKLWIGLELPSLIIRPFEGGYALQPMVLYEVSPYVTLWGGAGWVKATRDSLFNNLYDYRSRGWYAKAGADLNLNFGNRRVTGMRFGGGPTYSRFVEEGQLRFQYDPALFEEEQAENLYTQALSNSTWAAGFEFRTGLFADFGKFSLQLQTQISAMLRRPENSAHPTHYIPGIGTYKPQPFLGRNNPPRKMVPGFSCYLFYRLY